MNHAWTKWLVFALSIVWLALTAMLEAAWPVMVIPIALLLWMLPDKQPSADIADLVTQLKVLNSRLGHMDDCLRSVDKQLDEQGHQLTNLLDDKLHAMRARGEIP